MHLNFMLQLGNVRNVSCASRFGTILVSAVEIIRFISAIKPNKNQANKAYQPI